MANIFRYAGDGLHLLSILLLLRKIALGKSCAGVSLVTQELYLIVFLTRYVDLLWNVASLYNSLMKVFFIASTALIVYIIRYRLAGSYRDYSSQDVVKHWHLVVPCLLLALCWNEADKGDSAFVFLGSTNTAWWYTLFEVSWAFSIFLEAVAIYPQCVVHSKRKGLVDVLTADYVFCLGAYRLLYLFNWIYRWYFDVTYIHSWIVSISGLVQILLYCDFFYFYVVAKWNSKQLVLPV